MSTSVIANDHGNSPIGEDTDPAQRLHTIVAVHDAALNFQQRNSSIKTSRSPLVIKPDDLPFNLVHGTLAGDETIVDPYVFTDDDAGSLLAFYHLGRRLAGHAEIVHGGIAAVLLDECMGRACFPRLPGKIGVTARLELDYKNPIPVNSVILIQADTKEVQGRKAWVEATMSSADNGQDLVKAKALFIQPKWAADMTEVL
ncbi:hypothetical protein G7Z17_g9355 [Cylindrodendrum hubeiense]|uniref:Thioesterase domain-containing protein n=1 Tax=Cylindrodendrum hubeiense TaxID=595255 RepID=A0A9P5L5R8_9HYPO|nr:hypothetical protein G7Z17_g9355 [Cylindrodendrum hubeiense]